MGHPSNNPELGKLTGLKPINTTITNNKTNTTTTIDQQEENDKELDDTTTSTNNYYTKIMRITPATHERLREYSYKYHSQPLSYDEILQELLDFYAKERA
jgi:hypothetical protein